MRDAAGSKATVGVSLRLRCCILAVLFFIQGHESMIEDIAEIERLQNIIARAIAKLKNGDAVGALGELEGTESEKIDAAELLELFS